MPHKFENQSFVGRVKWQGRKQLALEVNGEEIQLSRRMVGILWLFVSIPQLSRDQLWAYLEKIGEDAGTKSASAVLSRTLKSLKDHDLIVEYDRKYYQTMKGRAVWLAIHQHLAMPGLELLGVIPKSPL